MPRSFIKFSQLILKGNVWRSVWRICKWILGLKVARYSFSVSIPPKFDHKLRHQKQSFGKIATTVVLDKDENLL